LKKLFIIVAMVVLISALVLGGCAQTAPTTPSTPSTPTTPAPAKVIKIGSVLGLTGPGSIHELMGKDIEFMFIDWINNEKGGVNIKGENYKVELVYEDGHWDAANCVTATTKLVHQENCKFIVGGVVPILIEGMSTVTEKASVMLIGIRSTVIWPDKPMTFYANYPFPATTVEVYKAVLEANPGMKTVGYLAEDEDGGRATAEADSMIAKTVFGLEPLPVVLHPFESTEYMPEWNKLIMMKPDGVDTGLKMPQNQANSLKQGRQSGYTGPIFAPVPGSPLVLAALAGKEFADNYTWNSYNPYDPVNTPPMVQELVKKWDATHNDPFDPDGTEFWDAMWTTVQAIEAAQSLDPKEVAAAWEAKENWETARGAARLGGAEPPWGIKHIVFGPASVCRIEKGETHFIKWFDSWMP